MANVDRAGRGAVPVKHLNGSPYNGQFNLYELPAGSGSATAVGDFVKSDATAATDIYPTAVRVAASGQVTDSSAAPLFGVVVGFVVSPTDLNTPQYRAGTAKRIAMVADAPDLIFEIQDGGTAPCTWTLVGMNTGITATAANTTTGASNMATGTTAPAASVALALKVMGIVNSPDNSSATVAGETYQKLLVMINQHAYGSGTGQLAL